ncbi:MAG: hypothetical protein GX335_01915 [Firmicutes bacterium]|nr:hypothetical protein [Bacillota bacterium]
MLKELLKAVRDGDYVSKSALAEQFARPVPFIEAGLAELVRMDYLQESENLQLCDLPCGKCPYTGFCSQTPFKTITVTEKGERLLRTLSYKETRP